MIYIVLLVVTSVLFVGGACIIPLVTINDALTKPSTSEPIDTRADGIHQSSLVLAGALALCSLALDIWMLSECVDQKNALYTVPVFINLIGGVVGLLISLRIAGVQIVLHPTIIVADQPTVTVKPHNS